MIFFEMYNPKPVPLSDFVANFSNSRGKTSGSIPFPVSLILIDTNSLSFVFSLLLIISMNFSVLIVITPYSVNFKAFPNKLESTCCILFLSAYTNNGSADNSGYIS